LIDGEFNRADGCGRAIDGYEDLHDLRLLPLEREVQAQAPT
jgi:hypothetical protein